mgnify:CR=1 FL=1
MWIFSNQGCVSNPFLPFQSLNQPMPIDASPLMHQQTHAVNFFGHAYLTLLLIGRLIQARPSRIVQVVRATAALAL